MIDRVDLWTVVILLAIGSFMLRFMFIGLIGDREMPEWVLRHLRYTAVALLPALVAPLVVWPAATQGALDAPRLIAALVTVAVGVMSRNVVASIVAGGCSLYLGLYLLG